MKWLAFAGCCVAAISANPAHAMRWTVDAAKSHLGFNVVWSGETFAATFKSWHASIDFDPADLARSHAAVNIDLASETSNSPDNDDGLKGPEGFAIASFPTARFETTGFRHASGNNYVATGILSLHGVSRPITLPFVLEISGNTAHMVGNAHVVRTDFGLGQGEWAAPTPIAHDVTIGIDLTATRTP